ncbi:MAG: type II toxin-antitoxin system VapC family toxin [Alphaproteobacteria bacterium]|nr:type II toxin-antitoxin system VapC family toxin [Alphaproteobacteria bacterium]MBL7096301.1 type II toxin-antitoxin system VapC family toxin [Alphaproteobacteria bacterium]
MYLLDTDVLSTLRRRPADDATPRWLAKQTPQSVFLSVITIMEIERGIEQQRRINPPFARVLETWLSGVRRWHGDRVLPVTADIAALWGRLQIQLGRDDDDLAIAATAIEHGLTVATRNVRHFAISGLPVINPFGRR